MCINARVHVYYMSRSIQTLGSALKHQHNMVKQRQIRKEGMAQVLAYSSGALYDLHV
jgi:hypothetical protein